MRLWKYQSIGNDFVLVEGVAKSDLADLAVWICERRFGVGSDGLLAAEFHENTLWLRMFNPDGTEDFCGNGIRCAVWHGVRHRWFSDRTVVRHLGRDVPVWTDGKADGNRSPVIFSTLGPATWDPQSVPLAPGVGELVGETVEVDGQDQRLWALSTGSTHTVVFGELPESPGFERLGSALENHKVFPNRTSVMFTHPVAEDQLELRIWERGVGETLGCGSGTCAAAAAYVRKEGKTNAEIQVKSKGGTLTVTMDDWDAPITVSGQAEFVFEGTFTWPR